MSNLFSLWTSLDDYIEQIEEYSIEFEDSIPIFIDNSRIDLATLANQYTFENCQKNSISKCDYGIIVSPEANFYSKTKLFCNSWASTYKDIIADDCKTLVIVSLYKDFIQESIREIMEFARDNAIDIYFLIGRDLCSLSWLIAKQFITIKTASKGLFTYKNLNFDLTNYHKWDLYDIKSIEKNDIKILLENQLWHQVVFHGHGKEDNLNLDDFTLCGLNSQVTNDSPFFPSCGFLGQSCFKDDKKTILLNKIKAEQISLLSCNNFPFYDARLYSSKYNLVLNAIDGYARNILASIGIQSSDNMELNLILQNSDFSTLGNRMNKTLDDVQPFISIISIGLPLSNHESEVYDQVEKVKLTELSKIILSRLSTYYSSFMINENHVAYKLSKKIMKDFNQITRRGTIGVTNSDLEKFESNLKNRVNPFSKIIAENMLDVNDDLHDFDSFNIFRSTVNKESIRKGTCSCGRDSLEYNYTPKISTLFEIETEYCYRCGDKQVGMRYMPKILFKCDENNLNKGSFEIDFEFEISPQHEGDIFWGLTVPNYIQSYLVGQTKIEKIKNKRVQKYIRKGTVRFDNNIPKQSYYLILFIVQNGGIKVSRCFFNLV